MEVSDQVKALRKTCTELGIKYHHMHGEKRLRELINAHQAENSPDGVAPVPEYNEKDIVPIPAEQFRRERQAYNKKEANRLIRCRIQCLDPQKVNWPGEMISVGSAKLGTFKKFVPFNTGKPWHLPKVIFDMLQERQCSFWYTYTNKLGHKLRRAKQGNAFALEVLPPLTKEELNKMSVEQRRKEGMD